MRDEIARIVNVGYDNLQKHLKTTKILRFAKSDAVAPSKLKLERQANGCRLIVNGSGLNLNRKSDLMRLIIFILKTTFYRTGACAFVTLTVSKTNYF